MKARAGGTKRTRRRGAAARPLTVAPPPVAVAPGRETSMLPGALAIVVLTLLVYVPALGGGFVWDDDAYVTANRTLRSLSGLWAIWTQPGATPQYYPLTFTSFWLEYRFWGPAPFAYPLCTVRFPSASRTR